MKAGVKCSAFVLAIVCCSLLASVGSATSASAAFVLTTKPCEGTEITLCWSEKKAGAKLFELEGEEPFEALLDITEMGEEHLLQLSFGEVHIVCEDTHATGTFLQAKPLTGVPPTIDATIVFTTCKLLPVGEGLKCELSAAMAKEFRLRPLVATPITTEEIGFRPETGNAFAEFELVNKLGSTCLVKGTHRMTVEGEKSLVVLLTNPETDEEDHLLWIKEPAGLLFAEQRAVLLDSLLVHFLNLEATDWWSLSLG